MAPESPPRAAVAPTASSNDLVETCQLSARAGAVVGSVTDDANALPLAGVTVVASSLAVGETHASLTDESGHFALCDLPPETYEVTFLYSDLKVRRPGITVASARETPVYIRVNTGELRGEVIAIEAKDTPCISDLPSLCPEPIHLVVVPPHAASPSRDFFPCER